MLYIEDINMVMIEEDQTEDFWSKNPCGIVGNFEELAKHRYKTEPYLLDHLSCICDSLPRNAKVLEIGCGQGTDALFMCSLLSDSVEYYGIDFSKKSVDIANEHKRSYQTKKKINCIPNFAVGDACDLKFRDHSFDFVYSMGVIHHIANMDCSIDEIYRVLKSGGRATVYLYRTGSPKVEIAKFLRKFQKLLDWLMNKEKIIYQMFNRRKSKTFGTMFLECFGVPVLRSVTGQDIERLFADFSSIKYQSCGLNAFFLHTSNDGSKNSFGYFYRVDLIK